MDFQFLFFLIPYMVTAGQIFHKSNLVSFLTSYSVPLPCLGLASELPNSTALTGLFSGL